MYDEEGEQVWERSLDLNGKVINGSNAPCPFLYQGQYYDKEIELAYNRFRYYDPDDGRYISKDPIGLLSGEYGFYNYVDNPNGWVDVFGLAKTYDQKSQRWRDTENGQYTTKPTDPGQMVHNGQINHGDIKQWANENGISDTWGASSTFPSGGFKYENNNHKVHGHGINPNAVRRFPGSNSATGPTASIKNKATNQNTRSDGTSGSFGSDPDGAHIPLTGSPY
ncbi:RHS repeat-associated core domain-containing protein [Tenacibaculum maritimum]|uniref:RHS repeat-associated core domain-containing protein n=2 Tax=Tenacibaculum maritimum TaxID=107401 RepID=UPI0021D3F6DD|nr:RHS repeat-associated core domain-containing protein [Tenacibaculum maritimum]